MTRRELFMELQNIYAKYLKYMTDSGPFRTHTPAQDFPATYTSETRYKRNNASMDACHAFMHFSVTCLGSEQLTNFVQNSWLL